MASGRNKNSVNSFFAHSTHLLSQAADVLGKTDDVAKYRELFNAITAAFNGAFVAPDGRIKGNTQACSVMAIAFGLVDSENAKRAAQYLVEDIEKRGNHLSTGFIGTKSLMHALSRIGLQDVAFRLLRTDTFPSRGFSIKHGATSIWERWDGWTPDKGFQDPGMNSFAHYSFGAVYQWMVENIGGIRSDGPAYKHIVIEPWLDPNLNWAKTFEERGGSRLPRSDRSAAFLARPTPRTSAAPGVSSRMAAESRSSVLLYSKFVVDARRPAT